jgi:hypothetical protein
MRCIVVVLQVPDNGRCAVTDTMVSTTYHITECQNVNCDYEIVGQTYNEIIYFSCDSTAQIGSRPPYI